MLMFDVIRGSVGQGGGNSPLDVRIVQRLLNDWLTKEQKTNLKVDGLVGPKTTAAIIAFQRRNPGLVDGRIDPVGPTIDSVFSLHISGLLEGVDVSGLGRFINLTLTKNIPFSDPAVQTMVRQYVKILRENV